MKIAVDVDDTLGRPERRKRAAEYIKRAGLPFREREGDANGLVDSFDWTYEDATKFMKEGGGLSIFTEAEARRGAKEALALLRGEGHEIVILTGRFKEWFSNPVLVTRDWLEKRRIPYDEIVAEVPFREKGKYCLDRGIRILVDDSLEACLSAQALGVRAVLAVGKHNAARAGEIALRGANWEQIYAAVRRAVSEEEKA